jgi:uncharacterized phiE125 gp8 family phage protein
MGYKVITEPTVEPVSIDEARLHLRLDAYDSPATHPDDPLIEALITAAREWAENFTGLTIAQKTIELAIDRFPSSGVEIELERGPVVTITSLTYVDEDAAEQTVDSANYTLDEHSHPDWWLFPADGFDWPTPGDFINSVKVRFVAGFTLPGDSPDSRPLPKAIRQAILLVLGHYYEQREDASVTKLETVPMGAQSLLGPYRRYRGFA